MPQPKTMSAKNPANVKPSSSAPPDQAGPIPGADIDSKYGVQSKKGRATALTEEVPVKKEKQARPGRRPSE